MSDAALPPGPPLPSWMQALMYIYNGPRFFAACQRRYGIPFTVRFATAGTLVFFDDAADLKTMFAGDPTVYHAGEANLIMRGLVGESSVLVIDEDIHRQRRRLMLPSFHRDAVSRQTAQMADIAAANISRWPVNTEFPVSPRMSEITLEVILRTVIGASDPARLAELRTVIPRLLTLGLWELPALANPALQRRWPWRGFGRRLAEADRLLYAEIADHRADAGLDARTDVLAMLMRATDEDGRAMTDTELRDQLMTLLAAGHDTTATALSWTLERLTRNPEVLATAVRAARESAAGDPAGDEYLDAVVKEALRTRPVIFDVGRRLTEPVEIGGYRLPAGVMVIAAIGLVHANGALYPEPERFDPDRMRGVALSPTTYLPFGGGNRRCLGATFATAEMRTVLREVLLRTELATTTAPGERQKLKAVTLVPGRGARIRITRSVRSG